MHGKDSEGKGPEIERSPQIERSPGYVPRALAAGAVQTGLLARALHAAWPHRRERKF